MERNPRYLNSPETDIFHKHLVLFALNMASNNISNNNPLIIVEGYMDVVTMHQFGFNSTVGTMGTALSEDNLLNIWKYCDEPLVCMDGDNAGYKSMVKISNIALSKLTPGKSLKFVMLQNKEDPDSYLKSYGKESMKKLISNSLPLIDFLWNYFVKEFYSNNKTPEKIALWEQEIYNTLDKISNNRIKIFYKSEIKNRIYYLTKQLFYRKVSTIASNSKDSLEQFDANSKLTNNEYNNENLNEKLLLYILIMRPYIIQFVIEDLFRVQFSNTSFSNIRNSIADDAEININKTKQKYGAVVNNIIEQCSKIYKIDKQTDEELINYWYYLLNRIVFISQESNEINHISNECKNGINNSNWQRLKLLKMYLLSNKIWPQNNKAKNNLPDTLTNN